MNITLGFLTSVLILLPGLVSLLVHSLGFWTASSAIDLVLAIYEAFPGVNLGPVLPNPISAFYLALVTITQMSVQTAIALMILLAGEMAFSISDTADLLLDRFDLGGKSWVFQHMTQPAENEYAPIATVFTSVTNGAYGVAYEGLVFDIRQGEKGDILSIALSRPERFLYETGAFAQPRFRRWPWRFDTKRGPRQAFSITKATMLAASCHWT